MADTSPTTAPQADAQPLSAYIRQENAKERQERLPDVDIVETVAPVDAVAAPAETLAVDEPTETPEEAVADDPTPTPERDAAGKFVKKPSVQSRIDKAIYQQREAERRAEQAEARLRDFEARAGQPDRRAGEPATAPVSTGGAEPRPQLDQFLNEPDPYAALVAASSAWAARQAVREMEAKLVAQQAEQTFASKIHEHHETGREKYPDFDAVMQAAPNIEFPAHVVEALIDSPHGADLMYYLGTHEEDARAVAAQSPVKALLHLGQLAARLPAAPSGPAAEPKPKSQAKPPIKPVGASAPSPASPEPDPGKVSQRDWNRLQNAAERRRIQEMAGG